MLQKALTLAAEMVFAARAVRGPRGKLLLALRTMQFHWHNKQGGSIRHGDRFAVNVGLNNSEVRLTLRTYAGDLFILYEVLHWRAYFLPESICRPDEVRTIIDCGAHIGLASLYFADQYPRARVIAVEPRPDNFELLRANTTSQPRVIPVNACIAPQLDRPLFIDLDQPSWGSRVSDTGDGVQIPVVTIDSLCRDFGVDFIDILKLDVEGMEKDRLADGAFLPRIGLLLVELHGLYDMSRLQEDLAKWGFTATHSGRQAGIIWASREGILRQKTAVSAPD